VRTSREHLLRKTFLGGDWRLSTHFDEASGWCGPGSGKELQSITRDALVADDCAPVVPWCGGKLRGYDHAWSRRSTGCVLSDSLNKRPQVTELIFFTCSKYTKHPAQLRTGATASSRKSHVHDHQHALFRCID